MFKKLFKKEEKEFVITGNATTPPPATASVALGIVDNDAWANSMCQPVSLATKEGEISTSIGYSGQ